MPSKIEMFDIVYIFYSNLQLRKKYTEFYITLPKKKLIAYCLPYLLIVSKILLYMWLLPDLL